MLGEAPADDPRIQSLEPLLTNMQGDRQTYFTLRHGNVGIHDRDPLVPLQLTRIYDGAQGTAPFFKKVLAAFRVNYYDPAGYPKLVDNHLRYLAIVARNNFRAPSIQGYGLGLDPLPLAIQPEDDANSTCYFGSWDPVDAGVRFQFAGNVKFNAEVSAPNIGGVGSGLQVVLSNGQFKTVTSSLRYKTAISPINAEQSRRVWDLLPVSYRHRDTENAELCWGLVAEDVAAVDPSLVVWAVDENGNRRPESVAYDRLGVLLLAELKRERDSSRRLEERVRSLEALVLQRSKPADGIAN